MILIAIDMQDIDAAQTNEAVKKCSDELFCAAIKPPKTQAGYNAERDKMPDNKAGSDFL